MSCKINRWKQCVSTPGAPTNTPASNELQKRLADMQAERSKQDTMWVAETPTVKPTVKAYQPSQLSFLQLKYSQAPMVLGQQR
jgi:hypothetical protein